MRVKELLKRLQAVNPEALVVTDAPDHEYREFKEVHDDMAFQANRVGKAPWFYADYGDDQKLHPDDQRVPVVVIL